LGGVQEALLKKEVLLAFDLDKESDCGRKESHTKSKEVGKNMLCKQTD
jgi:hypothetical protein